MPKQNPKILIVDDDVDDIETLTDALLAEHPGLLIESISNGECALQYLSTCAKNDLPDLLVIDYNMPKLSGKEVLERLQQKNPDNNMIKVGWSTSEQHNYDCLNAGASLYLVKPYATADIARIARKILALLPTICIIWINVA